MKLNIKLLTNLKTKEARNKVKGVGEKALKNVIIDIANDVINIHPWKTQTGNNNRSIQYEVGPHGEIAKGGLEGAVYSTSGYGGFL